MEAIKGKSALVFGGTGGISRAINQALLANGLKNLVLVDIKEAQDYVVELKSQFKDCKIFFEVCDITNKESIAELFKKYSEELGYIDILVNSAGIVNEENIELTYKINALGPIYTCMEAFNYMGKHKGGNGGVIINVASIVGVYGTAFIPIYASTKHAVVGISRSLMDSPCYEMSGVKIICLCPGITRTPMANGMNPPRFPELLAAMKEILGIRATVQNPEDVAEAMLSGLKDEGHGIWTVVGGKIKKIEPAGEQLEL